MMTIHYKSYNYILLGHTMSNIIVFVKGGEELTIQDEIQEASEIKVNKQVIKRESTL